MKKTTKFLFSLVIVLFLSHSGIIAQTTGAIKGFIFDKEDNEPCAFANIGVKGTNFGASTDINGYFTIVRIPDGDYELEITYVGYESITEKFTIVNGKIFSKNFYLQKTATLLGETVISAEREEMKTQTRIAKVTIAPSQIKQLPAIGGEPDFAQFLQVVPGITFTGDQGGQLYIRGGSNIQNLVLLDGMVIYNPFHSIGLFSVFDSDIMRGADVYTGGFNVEYGGRISSVMDITMRDGNPNRFGGKFSASTFGAKLLVEGPMIKPKEGKDLSLSYILSAKTSYLEHSSKLIYPYINDGEGLPFNYTDIYGKLSLNTSEGSRLDIFGFNFNDKVKYQGISNLDWNSYGVGANFIIVPPTSTMMIKAKASYSDYKITMKALDNYPRHSKISGFNIGIDFIYFIGTDQFNWGVEALGFNTDYVFYNSVGRELNQAENTTELAAFFKYKWNLGNLIVEPGLRIHYYSSLGNLSVEPRLGLKYNITETLRFKAAGGLYSQNLVAANSDRDVVNLFYGFLSGDLNLPTNFKGKEAKKLQKSQHVIAGFEIDLPNKIHLNIEGYLKNFSQLSTINRTKIYDDNSTNYTKPDYLKKDFLIESGYAYGVDFLVKYDQRKLYIWFVYSLGWVKRSDGTMTYSPHYDRRHNINFVATYKFGKDLSWNVSARWNLGSGFPFTKTAGYYESPNLHEDLNYDYWSNNGSLEVIYDDLNTGRLPYYHRLDLTLNKIFAFGKYTKLEINLGVTNVYNRSNIFYFDRVTFNRVDQLPIMPSLGLSLTF
ncbi:TonB-dependent receptor [Bacteroidales bacterium OttesenSCG-928-I21]|nr:TonB-dependent receptor [Bacteroidales bacterium OttesenSCG-928-I21]